MVRNLIGSRGIGLSKYFAALYLPALLGLSGCVISANIFSTDFVKITNHQILEVDPDTIIIKLDGQCPENSLSLDVVVNGRSTSASATKTEAVPSKGSAIAECDSNNHIILKYSLPDTNYVGPIDFVITAIKERGPTNPGTYEINFQRPEIPSPIVTTHDGNSFATNNLSPILEGICSSNKVTGLQLRINANTWQDLSCNNDRWMTNLGPFVGNPPTNYAIELRSVNTYSTYQYSKSVSLNILVDVIPPNFSPNLSGITSFQDTQVDEWFGGQYPIVNFANDNDLEKINAVIQRKSDASVQCSVTQVKNKSPLTLDAISCPTAVFIDGEEYIAKILGFDSAGNQALSESTLTFTVDNTMPQLLFTAVPPAMTKSNYTSIAWSMNPLTGSPLANPTCRLDGVAVTPCVSPVSLDNLIVGDHSFTVSVADIAGNIAVATTHWKIEADGYPPLCSISTPEFEWTNQTTLGFDFSCNDDDGVREVQCQLDGSTWAPCDSFTHHELTALPSGQRVFQIRAKDNAGNFSPVMVRNFKVDVTSPTLLWTMTPDAITNQTSASLSFTTIDGESGVVSTECRLDLAAYSPCISPFILVGPLTEGVHTVDLRAYDTAGNDAVITYTWTVDITPPNPPIMGPNGDGGRRPTFTWTSGGNGGNGVFRFKLNDGDFSSGGVETNGLAYTPAFDLGFGVNSLYVQERDAAGNWSLSSIQTFNAKCGSGEYFDNGNCQTCPAGTYQTSPNFNTSCTNTPIGSYNPVEGGVNPISCPVNSTTASTGATLLSDCLGNAGYFDCDKGACSDVGIDYYSAALNNLRFNCPANSYSSGVGSGAGSVSDCLAGVDYYDHDGDPSTDPIPVPVGSYSPYRDNAVHVCTNKPPAASVVIYEGVGSGTNSCPIGSVVVCDVGYIPNGKTCFKNSPNAIAFTNLSNQERTTVTNSNTVTVSNFDGPLTASCTGCSAIARNGVWVDGTSLDDFYPGDTIAIRTTTASSYGTSVIGTVTLGTTTSSNWIVGTRNAYVCNHATLGTINHGQSVTAYSNSAPVPPSTCTAIKETRTCTDGVLSGSYSQASCLEGCSGTPWGNVASGYSSTAYSSNLPTAACSSVSQTRTCFNGSMSGSFGYASCTSGCTGTPWGNVSSGYSNTAYSSATPASACSAVAQTRTCTNGSMSGSNTITSCTNGCTGTAWGNLTHGTSKTGYYYANVTSPSSCSSYATTRTCSNGTMTGNASYNYTSCTVSCVSYIGQVCGTGYTTSCGAVTTTQLEFVSAWCSFNYAPYYQTGSICSQSFSGNGPDGINGTGDDTYSVSCQTKTPYTQTYNCDGSCT